jgi:hypothetical protein
MRKILLVFIAALSLCVGLLAQGSAPRPGPDAYSELRWRFVGPEGNRISAVAGVPGDPLVYYAGSASGGIAKTTDGGVHWQEDLFDAQVVQSIGSLAVAPSDPNIVWAGTGEAWIRATSRLATASTDRPMPGRLGPAWGSRKRAASAAS